MDIDFSQLVSDNESDGGLSLINEDELLQIEEVDIYQYEGLPSELHLDELSDLSDSEEFRDEIIEEPEQSGMSAGLRQFALCMTTLQRPFQASNKMDPSAAEEDEFDDEPQELNFSDEDLIIIDPPSTADAPAAALTADAPAMCEPQQMGVDSHCATADDSPINIQTISTDTPTIPWRPTKDYRHMTMEVPVMKLIPLPTTLKKWQERTATPEMKNYIKEIRSQGTRAGKNNHKVWIPYDLREKLNALRSKRLAEGSYCNRQFLIQEYQLKQQWNSLQ